MITNASSIVTAVVTLDHGERFDYRAPGDEVLVIEQVAYSGGHASFVGRRTLVSGAMAKRSVLLNNIPVLDVPQEIRSALMGAVRAHIGEQARALGMLLR